MSTSLDVSYISPVSMLVVSTVPPGIAIITVALRFWIRHRRNLELGWDDWLLLPGLIITVAIAIAQIYGVAAGAVGYTKGMPSEAPPEEELTYLSPRVVTFEKIQFSIQVLSPLTLGFIKASFIMFYRRIFDVGHRSWFSYFSQFMLVVIALWSLIFTFFFIFYCGTHVSAVWGAAIGIIEYCPHTWDVNRGFAISDFIMDVILILIPIPLTWRLQLSVARKLSTIAIFTLGALAVAASAVRMAVVIIAADIGFDVHLDGDIVIASMLFWGTVEHAAAIIAACLPTISVVLRIESISTMLKKIQSKISLQSLLHSRSNRSATTATTAERRSASDGSENPTEVEEHPMKQYYLEPFYPTPTIQSHAEHTQAKPEGACGGRAIRVDVALDQNEVNLRDPQGSV